MEPKRSHMQYSEAKCTMLHRLHYLPSNPVKEANTGKLHQNTPRTIPNTAQYSQHRKKKKKKTSKKRAGAYIPHGVRS
ncbi:hypothetical protein B296_00036521 [Ensete ventricosum]|uniref:Uncharacterized protein n=1 Tax=Ensete ventricosum TaxID=4639 RepID=A0A427A2B0_ENSVE|nr:hypothetical protein B296_00036521 [Ensete ventricosum]